MTLTGALDAELPFRLPLFVWFEERPSDRGFVRGVNAIRNASELGPCHNGRPKHDTEGPPRASSLCVACGPKRTLAPPRPSCSTLSRASSSSSSSLPSLSSLLLPSSTGGGTKADSVVAPNATVADPAVGRDDHDNSERGEAAWVRTTWTGPWKASDGASAWMRKRRAIAMPRAMLGL